MVPKSTSQTIQSERSSPIRVKLPINCGCLLEQIPMNRVIQTAVKGDTLRHRLVILRILGNRFINRIRSGLPLTIPSDNPVRCTENDCRDPKQRFLQESCTEPRASIPAVYAKLVCALPATQFSNRTGYQSLRPDLTLFYSFRTQPGMPPTGRPPCICTMRTHCTENEESRKFWT